MSVRCCGTIAESPASREDRALLTADDAGEHTALDQTPDWPKCPTGPPCHATAVSDRPHIGGLPNESTCPTSDTLSKGVFPPPATSIPKKYCEIAGFSSFPLYRSKPVLSSRHAYRHARWPTIHFLTVFPQEEKL